MVRFEQRAVKPLAVKNEGARILSPSLTAARGFVARIAPFPIFRTLQISGTSLLTPLIAAEDWTSSMLCFIVPLS